MSNNLRKYLPWILSVISGLVAIWASTQPADVVTKPGEPYAVEVHDTVSVVSVVAGRRITLHDSTTVHDTLRFMFLAARRDTINSEMAMYGDTRADIDTTVRLDLGGDSWIDVRAVGVYTIETSLYDMSLSVVDAQLDLSSGTTWQWIERAAFLAAGLVSRFIH